MTANPFPKALVRAFQLPPDAVDLGKHRGVPVDSIRVFPHAALPCEDCGRTHGHGVPCTGVPRA